MKCLLVFDHLNDIIYTKYNRKFAVHINEFAKVQGLLDEENNTKFKINTNVIVQIFSPIVTSQRIMSCQFGNSYTSIQCFEGLNVTFEEYMGYLFISLGKDDIPTMKRFLSTCITIVRYLCGPNVLLLKTKHQLSSLVTNLIDNWIYLQNNDQAVFVEAIEQLLVNSDISSKVIQTLKESANKLQVLTRCSKLHLLLFVQNKFLGLYSSQDANTLSSTDMLFILILASLHSKPNMPEDIDSDSDDEFYSPSASPNSNLDSCHLNEIHSYQVLLSGTEYEPKCIPHIVHVYPICDGVNLIQLLEIGKENISSNLYETFANLHTLQIVQVQGDSETLRPVFEKLDVCIKKLCESLKKMKNNLLESAYKQLSKQWEFIRKKYLDFIKNQTHDSLLRAETSTSTLLENLKDILQLTSFDNNFLNDSSKNSLEVAKFVKEKLEYYNDFFKVKVFCNFSLGSRDSLTINKYLEEFPGLVHFLYIDRVNHRITTPTLDFNSEETVALTKKKIWNMINFSRIHLQEGHLSIMWKDVTFNYTYFLWFEDVSGAPLKPVIFPRNATKALPLPGILCGDFYQKLCEYCFPKLSATKIRCYELFCIHLGLVTASCVLEHTRRLAATIWELKGHPNHPIDLI